MKSIKIKISIIAAMSFMTGLSISCTHREPGLLLVDHQASEKLVDYDLKLIIPLSQRSLKNGVDTEITLTLMNCGNKEVRLKDWRLREEENVRIYYRKYDPGIDVFDVRDNGWKRFDPPEQHPVRFNIQTIAPGNLFFINARLPFARDPGKYWVIGELNLKSVDVLSKAAVVEIK
ncbi:MAG: hypothetical protein PHO45_03240 [Victivallaceae bacterium]|nr:hypothetical protein [Victivallaceae bacterium]